MKAFLPPLRVKGSRQLDRQTRAGMRPVLPPFTVFCNSSSPVGSKPRSSCSSPEGAALSAPRLPAPAALWQMRCTCLHARRLPWHSAYTWLCTHSSQPFVRAPISGWGKRRYLHSTACLPAMDASSKSSLQNLNDIKPRVGQGWRWQERWRVTVPAVAAQAGRCGGALPRRRRAGCKRLLAAAQRCGGLAVVQPAAGQGRWGKGGRMSAARITSIC